jgi:SAM-dependent methyltransferase
VLVLGCGPGRESVELARRGFVVTGVDRDAGMLDSARVLAASEDLPVLFVEGDATAFALSGERFDAVVVFSGLYNMVLPRRRRVGMLACAREHLDPRGKVFLTFLSDYVPAGRRDGPERGGFLRAIHDEHQEGDLYLVNEAVHIFPHQDRLAREAREAGFAIETLFRDQRTYDRTTRQVRGYAVLRLPE